MGDISSHSGLLVGSAFGFLSKHLSFFSLAHGGLALATSVSSTVSFLWLLFILHRRLGALSWREFWLSFLRNLVNACLMALPLFLIIQTLEWVRPERNLWMQGSVFLSLPIMGVLLYLLFTRISRNPDWQFVSSLWDQRARSTHG
jgi:peptidoglycan biosynthesis protein MviN/MurJ (putative lipid II flippase)